MVCSEKNIHYLALKGNPELCNIENRINQNKLSVNYKKTNSKLFSKTSKNESAKFKVATYSRFIETSGVVKYLGVFFFDKKLNWKTHTQFILDKMRSAKRNIV